MREYTPIPEEKNLSALQQFQCTHDEVFHPDVLRMDEMGQVRHVMQHLGIIIGEMSAYCDRMDHGKYEEAQERLTMIRERRVPDLLVYGLKLATLFDDSLEERYFQRMKEGERKRI